MLGIYAIRNVTKNKYYIGSSTNLNRRIETHMLKIDSNEWYDDVKNGDHFESIILKELNTQTELESYENYFIGVYNSIENGYNKVLARRKPVIKIFNPEQKVVYKESKINLITPQELKSMFKIDDNTYSELLLVDSFPFIKITSTTVRFNLEEVKEWVNKQRKED